MLTESLKLRKAWSGLQRPAARLIYNKTTNRERKYSMNHSFFSQTSLSAILLVVPIKMEEWKISEDSF